MKTTYSLLIAATLFCLTVIGTSELQAQSNSTNVAVVEIIFGYHGPEDVSGIYISYPDGKTEKVELLGDMGTENIEKNGITISKTIQKTSTFHSNITTSNNKSISPFFLTPKNVITSMTEFFASW